MAVPWTTTAQLGLPAGADGVALTPSGSVWVSSSWGTLSASLPTDGFLTGITLRTADTTRAEFEIDVAVGSTPTVIATIKGVQGDNPGGYNEHGLLATFSVPIQGLLTGAAVKTRIRLSGTTTTAYKVSATYYPQPLVGNVLTTAQPLKVAPSAASLVHLTAGLTAWSNSAWGQILASAAADLAIAGVVLYVESGHIYSFEVDLGIGTAPSGSVIWTFKSSGRGNACPYVVMFKNPLTGVSAGQGVVMRWRTDGDFPYSSAVLWGGLLYHELPL